MGEPVIEPGISWSEVKDGTTSAALRLLAINVNYSLEIEVTVFVARMKD